jgi:hypothetical protein
MKPTVLYRIASVLLIFLAAGHTIAILKFKPPSPESETVWNTMNPGPVPGRERGILLRRFLPGPWPVRHNLFAFRGIPGLVSGRHGSANPQAIGSLGWAFFALQFASIALSAIYFFLPPHRRFDPGGDMCGLGRVGDPGSQTLALHSLRVDHGPISRISRVWGVGSDAGF